MLHHRPAVRSSSPSRNVFLTWKRPVHARHDETIRNRLRLPVVHRCSLFLLLLVPHRKVAKEAEQKRGGFGRSPAKGSGKGQASKDFDYLMKLPLEFRSNFHENFHKTRFAMDFRRRPASVSMGHASSRMCAWAAAVRSLTTTASASPQSSHEPHLLQSLTQFLRFILPCPFPRWFPV